MQLGNRTGHGFECHTEVVRDVAARHRQRYEPRCGDPLVHLEQECCNPLDRVLAAQQQQMVFGVAQIVVGHTEQIAGRGVALADRLKALALDQLNGGFDDGFGGEAMDVTVLKPENVARQVKRDDLTAAAGQLLAAPRRTLLDMIDVLGGLLLTKDRVASLVSEFSEASDWP